MVCSQSLASRRQRPSHAKVRSTTQRRGRTSNPLAASERLTICKVQRPILSNAALSFGPTYPPRSEEHTSELQSLMRISYAVFCLKKKKTHTTRQRMTPPKHNYDTQTNHKRKTQS